MDERTKKRLEAQYDLMTHLILRHYSRLPTDKTKAEVLYAGIEAALKLGMEEVYREKRVEALRLVTVERVYQDRDPVEDMILPMPVECGGEAWGIGRGLPTSDAVL